MYYTLRPDFIGRDKFIDLFMSLGYRLKKRRNYRRTTYASPTYYPNLIKGMKVDGPSKIWQSDITYIDVGERYYYAVFIIDVYTKKIVGHQVSNHMRAQANILALRAALNNHQAPDIHHSDRGSQYMYKEYLNYLRENGCKISMSLTAQDNAYAERINRTIKEEYISHWKPKTLNQLKRQVNKAVMNYNNQRLHSSLGKQTPSSFEIKWINNQLVCKPVITIFDEQSLV